MRDEVSRDRKNWTHLLSQPEVVPLQMRDPDALAGAEVSDDLDPGRKGSLWLPILLVILLVGGGIFASLMISESEDANLPDCTASPAPGINWNSCNKRGLRAENANLDGITATNVVLSKAVLTGGSFKQSVLRYAQFEDADLAYADFTEASLKGANLHNTDLTNAILIGADLRYADLGEARLGGAQLENARFDGAIWVDGRPCQAGSVGECVQ